MINVVIIISEYLDIEMIGNILEIYNTSKIDHKVTILSNSFTKDPYDTFYEFEKVVDKHRQVTVHVDKYTLPLAQLMNKAKRIVEGDIIAFHNPETLPSVSRLEMITSCFETYEEYEIFHHIYGKADTLDENTLLCEFNRAYSGIMYERYFPFKFDYNTYRYCKHYGADWDIRYVDFDSVVMSGRIFKEYKWKEPHEVTIYEGSSIHESDGMHYDFCLGNLYTYNKSIIIDIPLTYDRTRL